MNFWDNYDDCKTVYESAVEDMARQFNVELITHEDINEQTLEWFNLIHILAKRYDICEVYEACLIYYVTSYFTDNGISAGVEDKYFKQLLGKHIFELYMDAREYADDEVVQKRIFLKALLELFTTDEIEEYEKHIFLHNIRVSSDIKEWFGEFDNNRKTVMGLVSGDIERPHLNMNVQPLPCIISFVLSYSEEEKWNALSDINDGDRLRELLY